MAYVSHARWESVKCDVLYLLDTGCPCAGDVFSKKVIFRLQKKDTNSGYMVTKIGRFLTFLYYLLP